MKCDHCEAEVPEGATRCHYCGAELRAEKASELLGVGCATLALIVFIPVGTCGVVGLINNLEDPYGLKPVVYFIIGVSALIIYFAMQKLSRK